MPQSITIYFRIYVEEVAIEPRLSLQYILDKITLEFYVLYGTVSPYTSCKVST
jgi:hypothetical protein